MMEDEEYEDYQDKTEQEEWKEMDDARRYREWESENRRPY